MRALAWGLFNSVAASSGAFTPFRLRGSMQLGSNELDLVGCKGGLSFFFFLPVLDAHLMVGGLSWFGSLVGSANTRWKLLRGHGTFMC